MSLGINAIENAFNLLQSKIWNADFDIKGNLTKGALNQIDIGIQNLIKSGILGEEEGKDLSAIHEEFKKLIQTREKEVKPINIRDLDSISNRVQQFHSKLLEGKSKKAAEKILESPAVSIVPSMHSPKEFTQTKAVSEEMKVQAETEEVLRKQESLLKTLMAALLDKYIMQPFPPFEDVDEPDVNHPEVLKLLKEAAIEEEKETQVRVRKLVELINKDEACQKMEEILLLKLSFIEISLLKNLNLKLPNLKFIRGSTRGQVDGYYADFKKFADKLPQWYGDNLIRSKISPYEQISGKKT